MVEKKNKDPIYKLGIEFLAFQLEWKKFLTNDFQHLVANVDTLTTNVDTLVKQSNGIKQNIEEMEGKILKALGVRAHNFVKQQYPD